MSARGLRIAAVVAALSGAGPASAENLFDAIRLAYESNPALRGQRALLRATDETFVQARAALGPQVSLNGQGGQQWARVDQSSPFSPVRVLKSHALTGNGDLSIVQPLYASGAAHAQLEGARASVLAGREDLRQMEAQVLEAVITAYLDVRRDRATIKVLEDEIDHLTRDFEEIKAKGAAGTLTKTDVAESEARLLAARAQLHIAQQRLIASNAEYLDIVGQSPGDLDPEPELPGIPRTVDEAFNAAEQNNPQLLSAIQAERAAREKVAQAKAQTGPNVSLKLDAQIQPVEPYLPSQYYRDLSVAAVISQPLFTSGMNSSKIREALERDNQAMLTVETTRRDVVQAVSRSWSALVGTRDAIEVQQQQVLAEEAAVKGNRVEQRVGSRSTFELMNAEFELTNSQVSLLQNRHDEYLARAQLLSAMGLLEARFLTPGVQTYDPAASLKRVVGKVPVPWIDAVDAFDSLGREAGPPPRISTPHAGSTRPAGLPSMPASPKPDSPQPDTPQP
jgi:outer membrane protein